jgi:MFS family permease
MSKNPVLSLFAKSLNSTEAVIGLIAAVSPLAGIFFSFPVGFLADKIGKKRLLIISSFVFVIAPLLYLMVFDAWLLIPIRFFHGIATAILGPVASAIICDAYPETKGVKLGLYSSATLFGRTFAPMLGGVILSLFSSLQSKNITDHANNFINLSLGSYWNYKMVYLVAFFISLPVLFFSIFVRSDGNIGSIKKVTFIDFFRALRNFLGEKKLMSTSLVEMAIYFTYGAFETYLPILLSKNNVPAYIIGLIFSLQVLAVAVTKPFFGKLSDNIDRRVQIIAGILLLGISIIIFPLFTNIIIIIITGIVFGIGLSLSTVATSTYVADVANKENLGTSMGALSSIMDIGHSSGPFIVGIIISSFAYTEMRVEYFAGLASCLLVCIITAFLFIIFNYGFKKKKHQ